VACLVHSRGGPLRLRLADRRLQHDHVNAAKWWSWDRDTFRYEVNLMAGLFEIIKRNRYTRATVPALEHKLFPEGDRWGPALVRYTVLLLLSTVIAAEGVIQDSTATVIGAMIIAPLMTPILATTAAIMMGNAPRAWRSLLLVLGGALGVIAVAAVLSVVSLHVVDFRGNSQITARVAPSLLDLTVALAAGFAGAFAISRDDVADSLPGVAVSIALVPPLCVVGISLSGGQWNDAWGALLLFLTNFFSILLAGGAVFAILGLGAAVREEAGRFKKGRVYRAITLGLVLVAIPLAATTTRVWRDGVAQMKTTRITEQWVRQYPTDVVIRSVLVSGGKVKIVMTGSEQPTTIEDLGAEIRSEVRRVSEIDLRFFPSEDYVYLVGQ
jgi:uncharacterized hydrophobic protein (TIGR00271 family)